MTVRKFSWVNRVCAVVGLATLSAGADAAILVLTNEGAVLSVDTNSAVATPFANYLDVPPVTGTGTDDDYSPNALGYNGNVFYATYGASPVTLYRNGAQLPTNLSSAGSIPSVAAADVSGDTYYYLNGNFDLYSVTSINGGSQTNTLVNQEIGGDGVVGQFGDLAINGGSMFVSHGTSTPILQRFNLSGTLQATYTFASDPRRYLGLAFDGGTLYGVAAAAGSTYELFSLGFSGLTVTPTSLGTIMLGVSAAQGLTDAASAVPLPAAAWLLLSGLAGFGFVARRRTAA